MKRKPATQPRTDNRTLTTTELARTGGGVQIGSDNDLNLTMVLLNMGVFEANPENARDLAKLYLI